MADFTVLLTDVTFFAYFLSCRIVMKGDEWRIARRAMGIEPGVRLQVVLPQLDGLRVDRVQVFSIVLDIHTYIHTYIHVCMYVYAYKSKYLLLEIQIESSFLQHGEELEEEAALFDGLALPQRRLQLQPRLLQFQSTSTPSHECRDGTWYATLTSWMAASLAASAACAVSLDCRSASPPVAPSSFL